MKTMIQIAILAAVLAPATTFADPRVPQPGRRPTGLIIPVPKPRPTPAPKPTPRPTPTPTPRPIHRKHHHHHHHPQVVYVAAASSWVRPVVQQVTYDTRPAPETSAGRALTTREFLQGRASYAGQRMAVCGKVTQSVRGMGGIDYLILDGVVRCDFPRDARYIRGAYSETNRYVTIVGTAMGGWHATASADLSECDRPF